jgi:amino acid adenylation domain-containing protein
MASSIALSEQRRRLLQELLSGDASANRRQGEAVEPRRPDEIVPASVEQRHVWLHASMAPGLPLYNEAITVHRDGPFSLDALERALNEVLRRHEMWRTSFEIREGRLCAIVHPDLYLKVPLIELSHLPEPEREASALRIATEDARQPLDLAQAPLLRAKVVRLAEDKHRLYLTLHHIIFDGVSIYRLLVPELSALYACYARGEAPSLPAPRLQYGDYAVWRERHLASDAMSRELRYWREKLSGELPELKLPADRTRPPVPSHRGAMETFHLSPELTASLKEFSHREGVTLYVALLAAFKAMLHRYSGQDDIVIGGVTDMRRRPELENVIGYFLNSVVLRTQPHGATTFRDYLREVQTTVVDALDASALPFDRVVREIAPRRDGSRHPLFQVLFSIQPPKPDYPNGWALTQMDVTVGTAKFDLYLELDQEHDRIIGRFLYSTDLFDAATIRRMIGHWQTLLRGVVLDPQCALARLPLLTPEEQRTILVDRNQTAQDYPPVTLHAWIEEQARRNPEAIAVECDGHSWRYSELMRRAQAIARLLDQAGAAHGTLVAIAMERSLNMVAGLVAILRLGGTYLPLDPGLPEARLALLIEDARPAIILADKTALTTVPPSGAALVLCEDAGTVTKDNISAPSHYPGDPEGLAYVLYTSGSTGQPKAVEIRHRSVVNVLAAMQRELDLRVDDRLLAVTTLSFDIAALELFLPLVTGARLIVASRADAGDPARLIPLIGRSGCTVMQATPATWRGLLAHGWAGEQHLKILCGGEALSADLASSLLSRGAAVWNMYGPTETTIWSLRHQITALDETVPIGRPLANTRTYILDGNGAPLPDLVAGELMIGGDGLARGYRNDPEQTATKFVSFASLGGERLYRTGDMARYRADGTIEFLGRSDNQVKIRGFRVGLEEVESAIASHPQIAACAVRAARDPSGESRLTAYLTGAQLSQRDIPAIRDFLRDTLPGYMVPTNYMVLSALPMTPNRKIDRKKLPEPEILGSAETIEPRDEIESILAEIWKSVLGLSKVSVDDNFFDLGGHSLLACVLVAQIQARFGRELPLVALFRGPTIASLAEILRSDAAPAFSHLVSLRPGGTGRPVFIVHGVFGNVLQVKELAERLTTKRPVYALQARGADPRQEPHSTIAEMVEAYVAAIRSVQPSGPYALAGYSFGGLVAYEMARWFRARGEAVDLLALFETDVYARYLPWRDKLAYRLLLVRRVIEKLRILPAKAVPPYLLSKLAQVGHRVLLWIGLRHDFVDLGNLVGPMAERYRQMYEIGAREFVTFKPKPYDGKLSVFRISGPRYETCDPMPIWRKVAAAVELFEIDGAHGTIMERPYVATLASQFSRCLAASEFASARHVEAGTAISNLVQGLRKAALQVGVSR